METKVDQPHIFRITNIERVIELFICYSQFEYYYSGLIA